MSNPKPKDIIEFVKNWRSSPKHSYAENEILTEEQITNFVAELQEQVNLMDFSKTNGQTIIGYSGWSNNSKCFKIIDAVCKSSDSNAIYISSLPAGELLGEPYRPQLEKEILKIVKNEETVDMIMGGYKNNERVGPLCGYGDYLSLDDFVSAKLMGESHGVSNNIIIFVPEEINPQKVFASTEIHKIFSNDSYEFINGIPKDELYSIYCSGEQGEQTVFQIISETSKQVVGKTAGLEEQAALIKESISNGGILNSSSSDFCLNVCYDSCGNQLGIELFSKSEGVPLISDYSAGSCLINGMDNSVALKLEYEVYNTVSKSPSSEITQAIESSKVYLNNEGVVTGRSFSGTSLEGIVEDCIPPKSSYKMNSLRHTILLNDTRLSNANMSEFYGASVDGLSGLDLIKAKDFMSDVLDLAEGKKIKSIESLTQKADDVLSMFGKDSLQHGNTTFTRSSQITETLEDGTKVIMESTDMVTAADAEKAGLPHCTIHGFRHSVASILDDNGVPIQDISVLLGHESVNTTERIYINRRKTAKETTINTLDSAINLNIA